MPVSEVFNIDCLEYMRTLPDKFFDLAIVDPPYGIKRLSANENRSPDSKHRRSMAKIVESAKGWNSEKPTPEYFIQLFRVSKEQIIWGANNFTLPESEYFCVWDKQQTVKNFASAEYAWVSMNQWKKPAKVFRYQIHAANQESIKIHPTQKPIKLYKWLLDNYAVCDNCYNEGFIYEDVAGDGGSRMEVSCEACECAENGKPKIFDSHMGSQSSRIAAWDMGFDYWGCELDPDYFRDGCKRFEDFKQQLKLEL